MNLDISPRDLTAFLEAYEDCERIAEGEYVVDLFSENPPLTVNIRITDAEVSVLAAAELLFSEDEDGWYMGNRIDNASAIADAFKHAMSALK